MKTEARTTETGVEWLEPLALALPGRLNMAAGLLVTLSKKVRNQPDLPAAFEMMANEMRGAARVIRALYLAAQPPEPSGRQKDDEPYVGPDPILLGIGKIRVAICSDTDDPRQVARELVIYDDGDGPKPVGTPEPEHAGKRADQVGKVLARLRVMNAKGAMVFASDLMTVIENAARADDGFPETKIESDVPCPKCEHWHWDAEPCVEQPANGAAKP